MKTIKKLESLKEFQLNNEMKDITGGQNHIRVKGYLAGYNYDGYITQYSYCNDFYGSINGEHFEWPGNC